MTDVNSLRTKLHRLMCFDLREVYLMDYSTCRAFCGRVYKCVVVAKVKTDILKLICIIKQLRTVRVAMDQLVATSQR